MIIEISLFARTYVVTLRRYTEITTWPKTHCRL